MLSLIFMFWARQLRRTEAFFLLRSMITSAEKEF
jgi:hypothetical protein